MFIQRLSNGRLNYRDYKCIMPYSYGMSNIGTETLPRICDVPAGAVIWRGTDREVRETLVHFERTLRLGVVICKSGRGSNWAKTLSRQV